MIALTLLALQAPLVGAPPARPVDRERWFEDASDARGASFQHTDTVYTALAGGAGWIDMDGDGDEDLLVTSYGGSNALLRNDGGTFVDVSAGSGIEATGGQSLGVIVGDFDEDGLSDAYVTTYGPNKLYRSNGDGTFVDVAPARGCDGNVWSMSASIADLDLDGDLDLYVGNYIRVNNFPYSYGEPNHLYVNRGAAGGFVFDERAAALGVDGAGFFGPTVPGYAYTSPTGQATAGCTNSTASLDYDEDGDPDLFEGNDFGLFVMPNSQWRNDVSGGVLAFTEVSAATGFELDPQYNMGIEPADFDHDGDWDFYLSDIGDNELFRYEGGTYIDVAQAAGPLEAMDDAGSVLLSSWASVFEDFDNDGWEDLYVVNGHIPSASFLGNARIAPNHLWRNLGDGTFERVDPWSSGCADTGPGRGVAACDVDRDGALDLYVVNNGALGLIGLFVVPSRLYRNVLPDARRNGWIELDLEGRFSNREAIGARVEAVANGTTMRRQRLADPVYLSSPSRIVHFGLGAAAAVERLTVRWPSGIEQTLIDLPGRRLQRLLEPATTVVSIDAPSWSAGVLHLPVTLENHDVAPRTPSVLFRIALPDGTPLLSLSVPASVAADGTGAAALDLPLPAPYHDLAQGLALQLTVYVGDADGSYDSDTAAFVVP